MDQSEQTFDLLPLAAKRRIDGVCARFEGAWPRYSIEQLVEEVPDGERRVLLAELLHIEAEYRKKAGEQPTALEYLGRFPGQEAVVRSIFGEGQAETDHSSPGQQAASPPPAGPPNAPSVPGYQMLDELGRGGMGVVYLARHVALNRLVALKFVLAGTRALPRHVERFRREAEAVARLRHPNIIQIYDIGESDGQCFLALEYAEAGSLRERLTSAPMSPNAAAALLEQVVRAVQHAHRQGVVHRDIKPANILLAPGGDSIAHGNRPLPEFLAPSRAGGVQVPIAACTPKLTDFGLALVTGDDNQLTETGMAAGTPSYMAPEQAAGGAQGVGPAADVWALGATLYECLTGRPPFRAATPLETLRLVLEADPVPPSQLQPSVPRDLETICLKCLQKAPERRYAGARELAQDLHRFLAGEPIQARRACVLERAWQWARQRPLTALLLGLLLLSVLAGAVGVTGATFYAFAGWDQADQAGRKARLAEADATQKALQATQAQKAEQAARLKLQRQAVALLFARAHAQGMAGRPDHALHALARSLKLSPEGDEAMARAIRASFARWAEFVHPLQRLLDVPDAQVLLPCPDGKALLVASGPDVLLVPLDGAGKRQKWEFKARVRCLALSPDGKSLLVGLEAAEAPGGAINAYVVSAETGEKLLGPMPHTEAITCAAFHPTGPGLLTGCEDGLVRVWDARGRPTASLRHSAPVRALAVSPDGGRLVVGTKASGFGAARLWDLTAPAEAGKPLTVPGGVNAVAFLPESLGFLTAGDDGRVRGWRASDGERAGPGHAVSAPILDMSISPDGRTLLLACFDGQARLVGRVRGELMGLFPLRGGTALDGPRGRFFLAAFGRVCVHRLARPLSAHPHRPKDEQPPVSGGICAAAARSPDGKALLVAESALPRARGLVRPWGVSTGTPRGAPWVHRLPRVARVEFSPDGKLAATASFSQRGRWAVELRDAGTGEVRHRFESPAPTHQLAFHPSGRWLAAGGARGTRVFNTATGKQEGPVLPHADIAALAWSPAGKLLAAGSSGAGGEVAFYSWPGGKAAGKALRHAGPVHGLYFLRGGKLLAVGGYQTRLYDVDARRPAGEVLDAVTALCLVEGGRAVFVGHGDGTMRLVRPGAADRTWHASPAAVCAAVAPDGTLLTGDAAGHCQAWSLRMASPVPLGPPVYTGAAVRAIAAGAGGLATVNARAQVRRWPLPPPAEGTAEALARRAEFLTGQALLEGDVPGPLPPGRWRELARQQEVPPGPVPAEWHGAQADNAIQDDDLLGARWHLRRLLALKPNDDWATRRLAYVLALAGHHGEAIRCLDALPSRGRDEALQWLLSALQPANAKAALWCAGVIAARRPAEPRWPEEQAAAARRLGNRAAREEALDEALKRGGDVVLLEEVALDRAERGRLDEAAMLLARADQKRPLPLKAAMLHATLRLGIRDTRGFALACRRLVGEAVKQRHSLSAKELMEVVWTACLSPEGLRDAKAAGLLLAEAAGRKDVLRGQLWATQGALALRAGDAGEAISHLQHAAEAAGGASGPIAALLALAHHKLGHEREARLLLAFLRRLEASKPPLSVWGKVPHEALLREAFMVCEAPRPPEAAPARPR